MNKRLVRESALKALYAIECGARVNDTLDEHLRNPDWSEVDLKDGAAVYFTDLVLVAGQEKKEELDAIIAPFLKGWTLDRIAVIDKLVLRMAVSETWRGVPHKVIASEYVSIDKIYNSVEGAKFVNGVLGKILATIPQTENS